MRIVLRFDPAEMVRRAQRGTPLVFGIALEHEGGFFPSEDWVDFGAVLLAWWLAAGARLSASGGTEELQFMDGPYSVRVERPAGTDTVRLSAAAAALEWQLPFADFIGALTQAAEEVRRELARLDIAPEDQASLEYGLRCLGGATAVPAGRA